MPPPAIARTLIKTVKWVDGWVSAAGRSCCVGRSQAELQRTLGAEDDGPLTNPTRGEPDRDAHASVARAFGERT